MIAINIISCIKSNLRCLGKKKAIGTEDFELTYEQLFSYVNISASKFHAYGYSEDIPIILKCERQIDFILIFLSLLVGGYQVIPIPYDMNENELLKIANMTNAVTFDNDKMVEIDTISYKNENSKVTYYKEKGIYHITSGTTGEAKICIRTSEALINEGLDYQNTFGITSSDNIMSLCPVYHSFALGAALMAALVSGAYYYAVDFKYPRKALQEISKEKITYITCVPYLANLICRISVDDEMKFYLRKVVVGAGKVTKDLNNNFKSKFGIELSGNYGSTETGGTISRNSGEPLESIGKPMKSVSIKICDDFGNEVEPNSLGELLVKTNSMLKGYFACKTVFDKDGYFNTGDIAKMDDAGNIYIEGRKKNFIKIGGKTVNLQEIDGILRSNENIKDCYLSTQKLSNGEIRIVVYIANTNPMSESDVRNYCKKFMSDFKIPAKIVFVEDIPRDKMGKIKKVLL